MSEFLPALVFSLVIGAQFLAVIAVHEVEPEKYASTDYCGQRVDAHASASARI